MYKVSLVVIVGSRALSDNADHNGHFLLPRKSNSKLHSSIYDIQDMDKPLYRMNVKRNHTTFSEFIEKHYHEFFYLSCLDNDWMIILSHGEE